jgi:transglutaminase superfamily protein
MLPRKYRLSDDCYICDVDGYAVVFQANTHQFSVLDRAWASSVGEQVDGWPASISSHVTAELDGESHRRSNQALSYLLRSRALVGNPSLGKRPRAVPIDPPSRDLLREYENVELQLTFLDVIRFLRSAVYAVGMLARGGGAMLRALRLHAEKHSLLTAEKLQQENIYEMKRILASFRRLRPFLWDCPRKRSLERIVLKRLLELHGYRTRWVIGVTAAPLRVHSWLQCRDMVIDDIPGLASCFTPIVSI